MYLRKTSRPRLVTLTDGSVMSLADLPPPDTRWIARRKAAVVHAVQSGLLSREDAIERYGLSGEELDGWSRAITAHGLTALKVASTQKYREINRD